MDCMHTYKLFINVRCDVMRCDQYGWHQKSSTHKFVRTPTPHIHIPIHIHIHPTTNQMEKGALTHIEYAQFISVPYRLSHIHTPNERDICHCEIFRYFHISMLHLSMRMRIRVCILGAFNGNSIQYSRRSKYFNYKHVSFYLFRFFFLVCFVQAFYLLGPTNDFL